jgi:hypothetical protein
MLDPLPDVPAVVEPLGPGVHPTAVNPTWSELVHAYAGPIRELLPGDRPKDWVDSDSTEDDPGPADEADAVDPPTRSTGDESAATDPTLSFEREPQRYKVQFTATQEYVDLLEEARDLLAHAVPGRSIEEVHLRAMRTLVSELKARRTGAMRTPAKEAQTDPRQRGTEVEGPKPRQRGAESKPRPRGSRHLPRAVRRAVWERDGARCTYVDGEGRRCRETGGLEVTTASPWARRRANRCKSSPSVPCSQCAHRRKRLRP